MSNWNFVPVINLVFMHENTGMEFDINDGMIIDGVKKTAQQRNELNCPND